MTLPGNHDTFMRFVLEPGVSSTSDTGTNPLDADGPCPVCMLILDQRVKEQATRLDWYRAEEEFAALVKQEERKHRHSSIPVTERSPGSNSGAE